MNNKNDYITEEEAKAILEKHKAKMAKRGIRFGNCDATPEVETEGEVFLFVPQTELSHRRLLKEMKEDIDDEQ